MTTKKQYLEARRWLDTHKGLIDKYRSAVREYESHPDREPYEGITPNTLIQDIPEFNRFNLGAIKNLCRWEGLYDCLTVEMLCSRMTIKELSESYGIGSGTIAKIKAAVEAAGLKIKRNKVQVISLFSGIGGFELAAER